MTRSGKLRATHLATALICPLFAANAAWGQSTFAPPRQSAESSTGVNYRSGSLNLTERDLSIGGEGPAGLSLSRVYNSAVDRVGPGANWGYSIDGYVSPEKMPAHPDFEQPQPGNEPYVYNVVLGGKSVGFMGGSLFQMPVAARTRFLIRVVGILPTLRREMGNNTGLRGSLMVPLSVQT